jgi:hypothetical protein
MLESEVEKYLYDEAKKIGAMAMKFVSPGLRGVPDRIVVFPGGKSCFVELKRPGEKLRKQQTYRVSQLIKRNIWVEVLDSKESVDDLVSRWGLDE